jgi:hypothetical protein
MRWCKSVLLLVFLTLTACQQTPAKDKMSAANLSSAGLSRIAKSDIDEVIELHQQAVMQDLKQLMIKLYHRNPTQRFDKTKRSLEDSVDLVFKRSYNYGYAHWEELTGSDIIRLSLDDDYHVNDRVLTFIVGLRKMLMASYDNHTEFYYLTDLNEQKLYNSARNIEVAAWLLSEKRDRRGRLLIASDSVEDETRNLSFQRLIGKMIATQDNLASIVSYKEGRLIKTVVFKAATMAFLPI